MSRTIIDAEATVYSPGGLVPTEHNTILLSPFVLGAKERG